MGASIVTLIVFAPWLNDRVLDSLRIEFIDPRDPTLAPSTGAPLPTSATIVELLRSAMMQQSSDETGYLQYLCIDM